MESTEQGEPEADQGTKPDEAGKLNVPIQANYFSITVYLLTQFNQGLIPII